MSNFTPQEIERFLQEFFDVVGTRQYIGARYVPIFGRHGETSIAWDNSKPYEPLTIVTYQGDSYTSRTYVPEGVDISNTEYWVITGAYNAQVEAYRREVGLLADSVGALSDIIPASEYSSERTVTDAIEALGNKMPSSYFSSENTIKEYVDNSVGRASFVNKKIIWVGDSFSDVTNEWGGWVEGLQNWLGTTIYNYAHNGSGFVNKTPTDVPFLQQLQTALTEHPDATDVVVYGGNNDCGTLINGSASVYDAAVQEFFTWAKANASSLDYHFFIGNVVGFRGDMGWTQRYYIQNAAMVKGLPIKLYPYVNAVQVMQAGFYTDSNLHPSVTFANTALKFFFANSLLNGSAVPTNIIGITLGSGITSNDDKLMYAAGDSIKFYGGAFVVAKEADTAPNNVDVFTISLAHPIPRTNILPQYFNCVIIADNKTLNVLGQLEFNDRRLRVYFENDVKTVISPLTSFTIFIPSLEAQITW